APVALRGAVVAAWGLEYLAALMDVFTLQDQVLDDYQGYICSFLNVRDNKIAALVERELREGHLWPKSLIQRRPKSSSTAPPRSPANDAPHGSARCATRAASSRVPRSSPSSAPSTVRLSPSPRISSSLPPVSRRSPGPLSSSSSS